MLTFFADKRDGSDTEAVINLWIKKENTDGLKEIAHEMIDDLGYTPGESVSWDEVREYFDDEDNEIDFSENVSLAEKSGTSAMVIEYQAE